MTFYNIHDLGSSAYNMLLYTIIFFKPDCIIYKECEIYMHVVINAPYKCSMHTVITVVEETCVFCTCHCYSLANIFRALCIVVI